MLFRQDDLEAVRAGRVTLAFRRWKRPTVKTGGSLLTAAGRLAIGRVDEVEPDAIPANDVRAAGFASHAALVEALGDRAGRVYRIELGALAADPRVALRTSAPTSVELAGLLQTLAALDRRAPRPWTDATLRLIAERPGVRAADLADALGMERLPFKVNVRKLKALGLTVSLEVGYELSSRGRAVMKALSRGGAALDAIRPGRQAPSADRRPRHRSGERP